MNLWINILNGSTYKVSGTKKEEFIYCQRCEAPNKLQCMNIEYKNEFYESIIFLDSGRLTLTT